MAGPFRWLAFFATIIVAAAGIYAIWFGVSEGLMKALATFAVIALGALALFGLSSRTGRS